MSFMASLKAQSAAKKYQSGDIEGAKTTIRRSDFDGAERSALYSELFRAAA